MDETESEGSEAEEHAGGSAQPVAKGLKTERITLGVIQTMKHRVIARRRRIGVQTDESFLRSCREAAEQEH